MSSEQQIRLALIIGLLISSNIMLWFKVYKLEEKTNWPIAANLPITQSNPYSGYYCGIIDCNLK